LRGEIKERGEGDAGPSATTSDTEVARNLHQPEGWRRDAIDFFVASPPRCADIVSSSLRELDAVALATNVIVFLGRDTRATGIFLRKRWVGVLEGKLRKENSISR